MDKQLKRRITQGNYLMSAIKSYLSNDDPESSGPLLVLNSAISMWEHDTEPGNLIVQTYEPIEPLHYVEIVWSRDQTLYYISDWEITAERGMASFWLGVGVNDDVKHFSMWEIETANPTQREEIERTDARYVRYAKFARWIEA